MGQAAGLGAGQIICRVNRLECLPVPEKPTVPLLSAHFLLFSRLSGRVERGLFPVGAVPPARTSIFRDSVCVPTHSPGVLGTAMQVAHAGPSPVHTGLYF